MICERKLQLPKRKRKPFSEWLELYRCTRPEDLLNFFEDHFQRMSGGNIVLDTLQPDELANPEIDRRSPKRNH